MSIEASEDDWGDDSRKKWKHKELRQPIRWTGPASPRPWVAPALSPQSPLKAVLNLAATTAEIEEHERAWKEAHNKYLEEQLRKLPLLAEEYGIDTQRDAWVSIVGRNDVWVLGLLLALAHDVVPGFRLDSGSRRGARDWTEEAQTRLIADVEAVKYRRQEEGRGKCSDRLACRILFLRPVYRSRYDDFYRRQLIDKRVISLNNRLVEARKKTIVGRLLAKYDGKIRQLLTDKVISLYAGDPSEAEAAKARVDALWKSMTDELEELQARANAPEQMRPRPRKR